MSLLRSQLPTDPNYRMKMFIVLSLWVLLAAVACGQSKNSPSLPASQNIYKCEKGDAECWNAECLYWTNKIRRDAGAQPLAMGSRGMLDNAAGYSRTLDEMKALKHQEIGSIKLPCGMRVFGENIAYNFDSKNPAWYCMNQWKKSPGHYRNIIGSNFASVVTGVFVGSDGRVSCTQIFAPSKPEGGERGCMPAPTEFPRGTAPQSTPEPAPTTTATATVTPTPSPSMPAGKTRDTVVGPSVSPTPTSSPSKTPAKADETPTSEDKQQPECETFELWGKYICEKCPGARMWTCRQK